MVTGYNLLMMKHVLIRIIEIILILPLMAGLVVVELIDWVYYKIAKNEKRN
jgi:hypothetical protein